MNRAQHQSLFDLFDRYVPVLSIAERTIPFQPNTFREEMSKRNFQTVLVQTPEGLRKFDVGDSDLSFIGEDDLMNGNTPLVRAFEKLLSRRRFFIETEGTISHIVTQSDLDKIPVRLVVFGFISVWETFLRELIRQTIPQWQASLSAERLASAQELYQLKLRRDEEIDLIQCLQLADLGSVFSKNKRFRKLMPGASRDQYDAMVRNIGKLRDSLAHSQPSLPFSWQEIHTQLAFMRRAIQLNS
ncbi:hypothetical protein [Cyclobacterium jeungdonense]|uniref:Swt1-like HEPN domain-containing protein n=1 Tax=Cyclobacterium jeungdonense TaxID=708087 RepID=A0ABT8C6F5_9BACT|nr:hypothetical protein [Cyclobacterium jeungdonense]MDN3687208.1 hypothetical protein [Cyclobacterium jeungdonense]